MILAANLTLHDASLRTYAMPDTGAEGKRFIDKDWAVDNGFTLQPLKDPIRLETFDGQEAEDGPITHYVQSSMRIQDHLKKELSFWLHVSPTTLLSLVFRGSKCTIRILVSPRIPFFLTVISAVSIVMFLFALRRFMLCTISLGRLLPVTCLRALLVSLTLMLPRSLYKLLLHTPAVDTACFKCHWKRLTRCSILTLPRPTTYLLSCPSYRPTYVTMPMSFPRKRLSVCHLIALMTTIFVSWKGSVLHSVRYMRCLVRSLAC